MTPLAATVTPDWLALREPADHAARARDLVDLVAARLSEHDLLVHDLGSGTGSMARWLAPQLRRPQRWVLHDRDDRLLALAAAGETLRSVGRAHVRVETRCRDVTTLTSKDLTGASLVTASALLDLLTADELTRIATACIDAGCAALLSLTVTGRVALEPPHPLDAAITSAFNDHQRRVVLGRRLLGPDAVAHATAAFRRLDALVIERCTPWRLTTPRDGALVVEWLTGWVAAACEQQPALTRSARQFLRHRLAQAAAGRLRVVVGHADLLALPRTSAEPSAGNARVTA